MKSIKRSGALAACAAALALGGCASSPTTAYPTATYPAGPYPASTYPSGAAPSYSSMDAQGVEWGRVTNVEFVPAGASVGANSNSNSNGVVGAVLGAVVGGVVGHQIGGGSGRDVATVVGAGAGAYVGNRIARNQDGVATVAGYRVTIQTDKGAWRTFEVPNGNDLRVGERVRVENGVIYRM